MRIKITSHQSPVDKLIESIASRKTYIQFASQSDAIQAQSWFSSPELSTMLKREDIYRKGDRTYQFVLSLFSISRIAYTMLEIRLEYGFTIQAPSIIINGASINGIKAFERAVYYMKPCIGILDFTQPPKNYYDQLANWKNNNKFHGDYFRHNCTYKATIKTHGSNESKITLSTLQFQFRTNFQNEQLFRREVASATSKLVYRFNSDYDKIKAIYRFIVDNVVYDYSFSYYSAYHALIKGTAVCEGVSLLLHSMLRQANIVTRIVSGMGKTDRHSWNIVFLNGNWYALDATWDLGKSEFMWQYFLRGKTNFPNHTADSKLVDELRRDNILVSSQDYERRGLF